MKKLIFILFALLAVGSLFQSCDNTKTYAEMLDEEKNAVNAYIKKYNIQVISLEEFEKDTVTDVAKNEYVAFSNGVYMQIVNRGDEGESNKFVNNNVILARFVEVDILLGDTTLASTVCNPAGPNFELYPDGFRYTESGTSIYGQFLSESGLAGWQGVGLGMGVAYGTSVPAGWLLALKYIRSGAHVKLIVPSKMGHQIAQQKVYPYFYDVRKFSIYY
ncbi:MAG: DUF4827 domain-containing protein [Bacteroides sp.]|nr:DUF4827 domain-containing protein [Bacteroides sp.]